MYVISACLLGENCKYSGGSNRCPWVVEFSKTHHWISICPEVMGGLPTPRPPVEIIAGCAVNRSGVDLTEQFNKGVLTAWEKILAESIRSEEKLEGAILKAKSPSCGAGSIYDGTFSHKVIEGDGFMAKFLKEKGVKIITEEESVND